MDRILPGHVGLWVHEHPGALAILPSLAEREVDWHARRVARVAKGSRL
jgi:hypothetical protein